ncbi:MAG: HutD family protein [Acetobacteraceae bacterium]|nr:HutD family protein [Acetobacteraceae bacterium]
MQTDVIRAAGLSESRWLNGAGRKADIASGPGWLVGFAWLERDAPFSDYADHDRTITLLEGAGFSLALPEGALLTVDRPGVPAAFNGAGPIACGLRSGPCMVLNVITAYPAYSHTVQVLDAADLMGLPPGRSGFLVVLQGAITVGATTVGPRDTVRWTAAVNLRPSADARVAVIRIEPMGDDEI